MVRIQKIKLDYIFVLLIVFSMIRTQDDEFRILGGETVNSPEIYPWMVALIRSDIENVSNESQFCGGTLISPEWVVTAAHCLQIDEDYDEVGEIDILLGTIDLSNDSNAERISVDIIIDHEGYNTVPGAHGANDIALLHLSTPTTISYLPIINDSELCEPGNDGIAIGWGGHPEPPAQDSLLHITLTIDNAEYCSDISYGSDINENYHLSICPSYLDENVGFGTFIGDSGGPFIVKNSNGLTFLAGIISWGGTFYNSDLDENFHLTILSRIDIQRDWIYEHLNSIDVYFINRDIYGNNLGGTLELENFHPLINSGEIYPVPVQTPWSIRTHNEIFIEHNLKHHDWNDDDSQYLMKHSRSFFGDDYDEAVFYPVYPIEIQTSPVDLEIKLHIHDPWYVEPEDSPFAGQQLDTFHILDESEYFVFLNQNPNYFQGYPIYSLKAPRFYVSQDYIYMFADWTSSNTNDAEFRVYPNHEVEPWWTNVVFRNEFAEITAEYIPVNEIENYNLIIAEDEILSIPAGSNLSFANGFTLTIEGSLLALGTADEPISISGGNGIYTQNANVELSHVSFDNTNLIYLSSSTGVVDNSSFNTNLATVVDGGDFEFNQSTFTGTLAGLVAASMPTEPRISVDLNNCTFENSSIGLATTYRAITTIKNCEFINNETGIFSDSFSEPWLFQENEDYACEGNNNTIVDNEIGFGVYQDSQPWLGIYWDLAKYFEGHNRIDNTTDIQNASWHQRPIYAQVNNWNSGTNCYPSSPNDLSGGPVISSPTVYDVYYEGPITWEDYIVLRLEAGGEYSEASAIYQQIIENNPNSPYALWALAGLARCMEKNGQLHELIELFEYYVIIYYGSQIEKYARSYGITSQIVKGDYDKAATMIASFESDYPGSEFEPKIRYESTILYKILQGSSNGRTMDNMSEKIQAEYHLLSANHPETGLGILATILLGDEQTTSSSLAEVPDSYSLVQVYPNPFNPITNITYEIPKESHITISIYDLEGRKLEDLVKGTTKAGKFNTTWNAEKYSSGVYLVNMSTPNYTTSQKVVLLK